MWITNTMDIETVVEGGGPGDSTYQPNWVYSGDFVPTFKMF